MPASWLSEEAGIALAAQQLIAAWEALGQHPMAFMGNLYQFVFRNETLRVGAAPDRLVAESG